MTLTEKIQSLTDLELAELWDLNQKLKFRVRLLEPKNRQLDRLYDLTEHKVLHNQKKEIIEAMRAEIVKRYLNQQTQKQNV